MLPAQPSSALPVWQEVLTKDGLQYFYEVNTRCVQWEPPGPLFRAAVAPGSASALASLLVEYAALQDGKAGRSRELGAKHARLATRLSTLGSLPSSPAARRSPVVRRSLDGAAHAARTLSACQREGSTARAALAQVLRDIAPMLLEPFPNANPQVGRAALAGADALALLSAAAQHERAARHCADELDELRSAFASTSASGRAPARPRSRRTLQLVGQPLHGRVPPPPGLADGSRAVAALVANVVANSTDFLDDGR